MKSVRKIYSIGLIAVAGIALVSCNKEEDSETVTVTDFSLITTYDLDGKFAPGTYSGQTTRIDQLTELKSIMQPTTIGQITDDAVKSRIQNTGDNSFTDASLNGQGKSLYSKIDELGTGSAGNSTFTVANAFLAMADSIEVISASHATSAANGQQGQLSQTTSKGRFVTKNGIELAQIIEKGMFGACFYDQMIDDYLATAKGTTISNSSADSKYATQGTERQHDWDEAFGYLGANEDTYPNASNTSSGDGEHLGNYIYDVSVKGAPINIAQQIMNAFIKGRYLLKEGQSGTAGAANDNTDDDALEDEAEKIEFYVEQGIAGAAFGYLNAALEELDPSDGDGITQVDREDAIHHISEAFGFIYSLTFVEGQITEAQAYSVLQTLGWNTDALVGAYEPNLWTVSQSDVQNAINALDDYFPLVKSVKF